MRNEKADHKSKFTWKGFYSYVTDYFCRRDLKIKIVPDDNIQLYRVQVNSGVHSAMVNLIQNFERHGDRSSGN